MDKIEIKKSDRINLELTGEEVSTVLNSLMDVPARHSMHIINNIQEQIRKQKAKKSKE